MLRFDGIYTCKMYYIRSGMAETTAYRPLHDVYTFKYIKFYPDGSMVSVYTTMPPIKFVPKFIQHQNNLFEIVNEMNQELKQQSHKRKNKADILA